ncbi:hypothetical protein [Halobacterium hubeiense]|uniref:hypothetical protein n=1 Tax=Halobacterium hubeiense TaxID=1407499 RepID=UPI001179E673|nr:hypothetical protein [Halobacterium hubeiense]
MTNKSSKADGKSSSGIKRRTVLAGIKGAALGGLVVGGTRNAKAASDYYKSDGNTDTTNYYRSYEAQHSSSIQVFNPHSDSTGSEDYWEFTVQIGSSCAYYNSASEYYTGGIDYGTISLDWTDNSDLDPVTTYLDDSHIAAWENAQNPDDDYTAADFFRDTVINTGDLLCDIAKCGLLVDASSYLYNEIGYLSDWLVTEDPTYLELKFNRDSKTQVSNNVAFDVNLFEGESTTLDILVQHMTDTGEPYSSYSLTITAPNCSPSQGYPCSNSATTSEVNSYKEASGKEIQKNPGKFGMLPEEAKKLSKSDRYTLPEPNIEIEKIPLSENDAYNKSSVDISNK